MLAKFNREHWHDEDEVRFIIEGRGLFHVHPPQGPVFAIEVEAGDLIRVPRGTHHWFDLCADRRIRAIRLFQDQSGWTPHYTNSGIDAGFQPLCFGPSYLPNSGLARTGTRDSRSGIREPGLEVRESGFAGERPGS
jgi:1,2-dihydroxy-3-keto-5-methylthiopentene dioxygenase